MSGKKRHCLTCRYFQDAGMAGAGWCTHPKRQLSSDVRILVRPAELACRNAWGVDMWMDKDGMEPDAPAAVDPPAAVPAPEVLAPAPVAQASFDDEITSVVSSEIHRSRTDQDLNDRLVEQTTILPEERLSTNEADDRFHLLARGGRDSVGQARQRHLRRRQGDVPVLPDDHGHQTNESESTIETRSTGGFTPDDYVEQETPASKAVEEESEGTDQIDEDVLLSQDTGSSSPRSRRLRRSWGLTQSPKFGTGVAMEPDADALHTELLETGVRIASHFEAILQSSSDVDPLPPRRESSPSGTEEPGTSQVKDAPSPGTEDNAYDHVMKRTQGIKAAARVEREERVRHEQRRTVAPLGMDDRAERPSARFGAPIARRVAPGVEDLPQKSFSENKKSAALLPDPAAANRDVIRSRRTAYETHTEVREADDVRRAPTEHWSPTSHRQEARSSWWRGLFNRTDRSPAHDIEDWEEGNDETYLSSSSAHWETDETSFWLDEHKGESAAQYELIPDASSDEDGEWTNAAAAAYEDDNQPTSGRVGVEFERLDLQNEVGMIAFRERLFTSRGEPGSSQEAARTEQLIARAPVALSHPRPMPTEPTRGPRSAEDVINHPIRGAGQGRARETQQNQESAGGRASHQVATRPRPGYQRDPERTGGNVLPASSVLGAPADEGFEPEVTPQFDIRAIVEQRTELLDMAITIAPDVPRSCSTCRSYRMSEQGERGWCTNNWAFTHRQMVNATDIACQSTIGCWWLPADEEVGLIADESDHVATPRVDRLIAQLDPLKHAVGR
jgi:hypothetical protein